MYLKHLPSGDLVEVLGLKELFDPFRTSVVARFHHGEELQDPEHFAKSDLVFPSGEALPQAWLDPEYKAKMD
jgi:hypothetical protein